MLKNSRLWPKLITHWKFFVFYEGNDLINNLHEVEQRGLDLHTIESNTLDQKIAKIIKDEERKLAESWVIALFGRMEPFFWFNRNYYRKFYQESKPEPQTSTCPHCSTLNISRIK